MPKKPVTTPNRIVEDFLVRGWKNQPHERLIHLLRSQRDQLFPVALQVMERIPQGGTFFDLILSHLTEAEFSTLVELAVTRLKSGPADVLNSIVAYASLQFPGLLTRHLRELYSLRPNSGTYYEKWPWRGADEREVEWLKEAVIRQSDRFAWGCLVESRRLESLVFAEKHSGVALVSRETFTAYAHGAGYDFSGPSPRRLHSDTAYHIVFGSDHFDESKRPVWLKHENHPTWRPHCTSVATAGFGGDARGVCAQCDGPLHRLIHIEDAPTVLAVRLPAIELCTCLSCLGWETPELFFRHDENGRASSYTVTARKGSPEFPAKGLKQGTVSLVPATARWNFQDWALSNGRENLNRVGGAPTWIQDSSYCICPHCARLMSFIAQLDSDLPDAEQGEWLWGSGGICYVFWCDPCAISGNLWQCT